MNVLIHAIDRDVQVTISLSEKHQDRCSNPYIDQHEVVGRSLPKRGQIPGEAPEDLQCEERVPADQCKHRGRGHKINRKDWGLNWNSALETGGVLVGDEVRISAEVHFVKQ